MQGPVIKLRPVMRGKIVFKPPKISISGTWAAQEADTTWSDFAYRSTGPVILPTEVTPKTPPIDFDATGYFNISAPGRAPQRCNETAMRLRIGGAPWPEAKPADRPPMQPNAPLVGVRGDGRNRHGTFRIVGSFCPASGGVWLLKVYTGGPEDSKRASRDAAKRSRGLPSPTPVLGGRAPRLAALEPRASSVQLSSEMQRCLSMTRRILSDPASGPFASPVDPVRDHCPTYFTVVKHPMDLGTVMRNTAQGKYASHEEWAVDVARVFTNATAFNPPEHWVHSSAAKLHREFKVQYARFVEAQASRERDAALKQRAMEEAAATAAAAIGASGSARPASVADSASTGRHGSGQRRAAAKAQRVQAAAARAAEEDFSGAGSTAASATKGKSKSKSGGGGGKGARGLSGGKEARRASGGAAGSRAKRPRQQAFSDQDEDEVDGDSLDLGLESDDDDGHGASRGHGTGAGGGSKRKGTAGRSKRARQSAAGSVDLRQENGQLHSRISAMQSQIDQMQAMIVTLFAQQGDGMPAMADVAMGMPAPPAPPAASSSSRRKGRDSSGSSRQATVAEQKELQENWGRLNPNQEQEALDIIQQSVRVDESMEELDLKDLDPKTFRAVQRFVAECIGKPRSKKSKSKASRGSSASGGGSAAGGSAFGSAGGTASSSSAAAAAAASRQFSAGKRAGGAGSSSSSSSSSSSAAGSSGAARGEAQVPGVMGELSGGQPFFAHSPMPQSQNPPSRPMAPLAGAPVPSLVEEDWEGLDDDLGNLGPPPVSGSAVPGVSADVSSSSSGLMLGHAGHPGDGVGGASVDSGAMGASLMAPLPSTTAPVMSSSSSSVTGLSPAPTSMSAAGPMAMGGTMPGHADMPASVAVPASSSMADLPGPDTAATVDRAAAMIQATAARREAEARAVEARTRTALEEAERKKESMFAAEAAREQELLERKRNEEETAQRLKEAKARAADAVRSSALPGDDDDDDDMDEGGNGIVGDDDDDDDGDDDGVGDDLADDQDGQDDNNTNDVVDDDDDDDDDEAGFDTKSDALHSSADHSGAADFGGAADLGPEGGIF